MGSAAPLVSGSAHALEIRCESDIEAHICGYEPEWTEVSHKLPPGAIPGQSLVGDNWRLRPAPACESGNT